MRLDAAIQQAVADRERNPKGLLEVADFMRSLGWNYSKSFQVVRKVLPTLTVAEWDEMLLAAENALSEG